MAKQTTIPDYEPSKNYLESEDSRQYRQDMKRKDEKKPMNGFKITSIGEIPVEWEVVELGKICEAKSGGTPLRSVPEFYDGNIPWAKIGDISMAGKFIYEVEEYITELGLENSSARIFPKDTVFLAMYGSIGKVAIGARPISCNQAILGIQCGKILNNEFLYYWLLFNEKRYLCSGQETTQNNLSARIVKKFHIPLPKIPEQQRIASILSSVDFTIQKTQSIIEKAQKLKKGLMQELFIKGIGHTRFKKTENGEIPEEWEVAKFENLIRLMKSGISRQFSPYDIGIPVIRSKNIQENRLDLNEIKFWYLRDPQGTDLTGYVLDDQDILLNFINSIDQIGKCCLFQKQKRDFIYTTNIFRIKTRKDKITHEYFYLFSQSYLYQFQLNRIVKPAVNQASFTKPDFMRIEIPLPSLSEQKRIVSIISSIDKKIEREQQYKSKLEQLKRGLMQDLLTGKVRAKVDK